MTMMIDRQIRKGKASHYSDHKMCASEMERNGDDDEEEEKLEIHLCERLFRKKMVGKASFTCSIFDEI